MKEEELFFSLVNMFLSYSPIKKALERAQPLESKCHKVFANFPGDKRLCKTYDELRLDARNETCDVPLPRVLHVTGWKPAAPRALRHLARDSGYQLEYRRDAEAGTYIREHCGKRVGDAFDCLLAPAYKADVYRYCVLWSKGGIYLDADIRPIVPLEELYNPCRTNMGYDWFVGNTPQKQMKLLASYPRSPTFRCVLDTIASQVQRRFYPSNALGVSGPIVLQTCYEKWRKNERSAVTYLDTRPAAWPFTGLRTHDEILAYEKPNPKRHLRSNDDAFDYDKMFRRRTIYCPPKVVNSTKL